MGLHTIPDLELDLGDESDCLCSGFPDGEDDIAPSGIFVELGAVTIPEVIVETSD